MKYIETKRYVPLKYTYKHLCKLAEHVCVHTIHIRTFMGFIHSLGTQV